MDYPLTSLLAAIGRLEDRLVKSTAEAESRCCHAYLQFHSDGSGCVRLRWTQKARYTPQMTHEERATADFLATILAEEGYQETQEDFSTLSQLQSYLIHQNVL